MNTNSFFKSLTALCFLTGFAFCHPKLNETMNDCLKTQIDEFSRESCNKAVVKEYEFQEKKVYVFDQSGCGNDMAANVYDAQCKKLGFLGGFTGNMKINGEDFSNAKLLRTVWEAK